MRCEEYVPGDGEERQEEVEEAHAGWHWGEAELQAFILAQRDCRLEFSWDQQWTFSKIGCLVSGGQWYIRVSI